MIDEDVAHQVGGGGEEMGAALPGNLRLLDEEGVGFVDQRGGLQGVVAALGAHIVRGQAAQFPVDLGNQERLDLSISRAELHQQGGDRVVGASRLRCESSHTFGSSVAGL